MNRCRPFFFSLLLALSTQALADISIDGSDRDWKDRYEHEASEIKKGVSMFTNGESLFISYRYTGSDSAYIPISSNGGMVLVPNNKYNSIMWIDLDKTANGKPSGFGRGAELEIGVSHSRVWVNRFNSLKTDDTQARAIFRSGPGFNFASSDDLRFWEIEIFLDELFPPQYSSKPYFRDIALWMPEVYDRDPDSGELKGRSGFSNAELISMLGYNPATDPLGILRPEPVKTTVTYTISSHMVGAEAEVGFGFEIDGTNNSADVAPITSWHTGNGTGGVSLNLGFYPMADLDDISGTSTTISVNSSFASYSHVIPTTIEDPLELPDLNWGQPGTGHVVSLSLTTPGLPVTAQFGETSIFRFSDSLDNLIKPGDGSPSGDDDDDGDDGDDGETSTWPEPEAIDPETGYSCRRLAC
nr:hypothetical protein 14 [Saccharospirillaceae bacterium]